MVRVLLLPLDGGTFGHPLQSARRQEAELVPADHAARGCLAAGGLGVVTHTCLLTLCMPARQQANQMHADGTDSTHAAMPAHPPNHTKADESRRAEPSKQGLGGSAHDHTCTHAAGPSSWRWHNGAPHATRCSLSAQGPCRPPACIERHMHAHVAPASPCQPAGRAAQSSLRALRGPPGETTPGATEESINQSSLWEQAKALKPKDQSRHPPPPANINELGFKCSRGAKR